MQDDTGPADGSGAQTGAPAARAGADSAADGEARPAGATGEPSVDAALSALHQLDGLPVAEHPAVFEQTHQRLRQVLDELAAAEPTDSAGREGSG
jgi:hypothetical protein